MNNKRTMGYFLLACVLLQLWLPEAVGFVSPRTLTRTPSVAGRRSNEIVLNVAPRGAVVGNTPRGGATLALAGRLFSSLKKIVWVSSVDITKIGEAIMREGSIGDLAVLSLVFFGTMPFFRCIHRLRHGGFKDSDWLRSKSYRFAKAISRLSIIGGFVYLVDMLSISLKVIGITKPYDLNFGMITAQIGFAVWFAANVASFKQFLLCRFFKARTPDDLGKNSIYDRLADGIIYFTALLFILDILAVETGRAIGSVFALGSVGTLVLSLASKDIAADFVSGLALSASNKFHEGEEVRIGADKYVGIVKKIGWMSTDIRGYDEIVVKIPNSQIVNQHISNISRINMSQVKQWVYFDYKDIESIPDIITDIKEEISKSCPKLVLDGSRPFFVHWREFKETKLEVVVDAHFRIRHGCAEYFDTKQKVLEAIARAAKKNGVKFAVPVLSLRTEDGATVWPTALLSDSISGPANVFE